MIKIFLLALIIIIFFSFSLAIKIIVKGESRIKGACCSDNHKDLESYDCSVCNLNKEDTCSPVGR